MKRKKNIHKLAQRLMGYRRTKSPFKSALYSSHVAMPSKQKLPFKNNKIDKYVSPMYLAIYHSSYSDMYKKVIFPYLSSYVMFKI